MIRRISSSASVAMVHLCRFRIGFFNVVLVAVGAMIMSHAVLAQQIYKSINENGVVEYSTIPPSGEMPIETLSTNAEPTEAEIRAAQNELENLRRSLEERALKRQEAAQPEEDADSGDEAGSTSKRPNPLPIVTPFL